MASLFAPLTNNLFAVVQNNDTFTKKNLRNNIAFSSTVEFRKNHLNRSPAILCKGRDDLEGAKENEDSISYSQNLGDWREFRARLVKGLEQTETKSDEGTSSEPMKSWAHSLAKPEKGCLLIAHPNAFLKSQTYFHRAVIFILNHQEDGSLGLILNKSTEYKLGQIPGFEPLMPEFADVPLYLGGDVGRAESYVLHKFNLEGSVEVVSGVYSGGFNAIVDHVKIGLSNAMDYRWFARYSGWGPNQLEKEVAAGVWFLGTCSADLVLKHWDGQNESLWKTVLELMGGEYQEIARKAFDEP